MKRWEVSDKWEDKALNIFFTYDLQQEFKGNKIAFSTVSLNDLYIDKSLRDSAAITNDPWEKYRVGAKNEYIARFLFFKNEHYNRYFIVFELSVDKSLFNKLLKQSKDSQMGYDKMHIVFKVDNFRFPTFGEQMNVFDLRYSLSHDKFPLVLEGWLLDYYIPKSTMQQ